MVSPVSPLSPVPPPVVVGPTEEMRVGGEEATVDWGHYIDVLRRRKWLIAAVAVAAVVVGAGYTARQTKLYETAASIVIETTTPRVLTGVEDVVDVGAAGWVPESFYETEYEVMKSRAVARAAGERIGIARDDQRNGIGAVTDPAEREKYIQALDPADLVIGRYSVEPDKRSSVVRIAVVDRDPKFAADLANAVAEAYLDKNLEKRVEGTRDASTWLAAQHADLKKKLEASEDALYAFMANNDVLNASLESQQLEVKQRLEGFNHQLATEEGNSIREQKTADVLKQVQNDPSLINTLDAVQNAPVASALRKELETLRTERERLSAKYQPDYPKMQEIDKQMKSLETRLGAEIQSVLVAMQRRQDQMKTSIEGLRDKLNQERQREARLNKLALEYSRLKREVDTNSKLYDMVTSRMKEADITSALPFNNVRILDHALEPKAPFRPNLRNNLMLGLLIGLMLGVALALVLDLVDNTVKSQEDIERLLDVPLLGLLPLIEAKTSVAGGFRRRKKRTEQERLEEVAATRDRDLYVLREPKSAAAECARFIRTNLLFMSPDRPLKTLVVTSPAPQEGKTTTAVSIAITMAQAGSSTLIVDTDLRRPRLHRVFDLPSDRGLSSVIVGESSLSDAIQKSEVPNLDVLVCGPLPPNPAEILHTERFAELIEELKGRYDRIIFDTPPAGPVTDPVVLGAQVDGTVLVVKCERTTKDMAKQAYRALTDAKARVLGVILNDVDVNEKRYSRVYYSYYRRYGAYYGDKKADGAKEAA